jgi:hypothetical protein
MAKTSEDKPAVETSSSSKTSSAPRKKEAATARLSAVEYCSSKGFNKLDALIFTKVMANKCKGKRLSPSEWDAKRSEFYSRKA